LQQRLTGQDTPNVNSNWFDDLWDDWEDLDEDEMDQDELLAEFEKMLHEEDNNYRELAKGASNKPDECMHQWIKTGVSPVLAEQWWNCKKCSMKKEVYEKSKEYF